MAFRRYSSFRPRRRFGYRSYGRSSRRGRRSYRPMRRRRTTSRFRIGGQRY